MDACQGTRVSKAAALSRERLQLRICRSTPARGTCVPCNACLAIFRAKTSKSSTPAAVARLRKWAAPQLERSALGPRPAVKAADKIVEGAALIPALEWSNLELLKCFEGFEDPELDLACQ
jgi:hypothetical protein